MKSLGEKFAGAKATQSLVPALIWFLCKPLVQTMMITGLLMAKRSGRLMLTSVIGFFASFALIKTINTRVSPSCFSIWLQRAYRRSH